jgi:NAD(P)-dependent dehydrogenase (short-subunit alcohol dehydrogenase family)
MTNWNRGGVVITGSSTGIGKTCALLLDRAGYQVFAGVRTQEAAEGLQEQASKRLTPVLLDITDSEQISSAVEIVATGLGKGAGLLGLVNNAGIVIAGPLEFLPIDRLRQQMEVNVIGHFAVTQSFLPLLRQGNGRIVNMSTAGCRFAVPFLGPYIASKIAMEALTDSLRRELMPWKIHVSIVEPGVIETPIWEKSYAVADAIESILPSQAKELYAEPFAAGRRFIEKLQGRAIPPDAVAKVVRSCLEARRPKSRYIVGVGARLPALIATLVPDRLTDWGVRKVLRL